MMCISVINKHTHIYRINITILYMFHVQKQFKDEINSYNPKRKLLKVIGENQMNFNPGIEKLVQD